MEQVFLALLERGIKELECEKGRYCSFPEYTVRIIRGTACKSVIRVCGNSVRSPAFRLAECIKRRREERLGMPVFIQPVFDGDDPLFLDDRIYVKDNQFLALLAGSTALGFKDFTAIKSFGCKGWF